MACVTGNEESLCVTEREREREREEREERKRVCVCVCLKGVMEGAWIGQTVDKYEHFSELFC